MLSTVTVKTRHLSALGPVALICVLSACSLLPGKQAKSENDSKSSMPHWVQNPASLYPDDQFLAATGSAANAQLAQRNARGNIAQIFSSRIRQSTISGTSTQNDDVLSYASRVALSSSNEEIVGIKLGESWYDSSAGMHYTLAYLHKGEYAQYLAEQVELKQAELNQLTPQANSDTAAAKFRALRAYHQQLLLLPDLERLLRHQLVVSKPANISSSLSRRMIQQNYDTTLRGSQFCLQIESEHIDFVQLISKAIADVGWQIRAADSDNCLQLLIEFELELDQPKADWHFSAINLGYSISDDRQSLSAGSLALDTTAVKPKESIRRLKTKITDELPELMLADALK